MITYSSLELNAIKRVFFNRIAIYGKIIIFLIEGSSS